MTDSSNELPFGDAGAGDPPLADAPLADPPLADAPLTDQPEESEGDQIGTGDEAAGDAPQQPPEGGR